MNLRPRPGLASRPVVLVRTLDLYVQVLGHPQYKLGISEELPGHEHKVRPGDLPVLQLDADPAIPVLLHDFASHVGLPYLTNRRNLEIQPLCPHGLSNLAREVALVVRVDLDLLVVVVATAADIEDIDGQPGEDLGQADAVVDIPGLLVRILHPLRRRDAEPQRRGLGDDGTHRRDDLPEEPSPVLKATAVVILQQRYIKTYVCEARKELRNQIAMRTMDLNNIKPSLHSPPRSISEPLNQPLDILQRQSLRGRIVPSERNRARRHHIVRPPADSLIRQVRPRPIDHPPGEGTSLAPRVRELDARLPALAVHEVDDAPQRRDLGVLPEPQAVWGDAPARLDGRGLDDGQRGAGEGELAQVDEVEVGGVPVPGAVGAHGGHDEAVLQRHAADPERPEQGRRRGCVQSRSCGWVLCGREEGDALRAGVAQIRGAEINSI
ncbi:unnamed protein product [Clonostachys chloroleuca]|uniref:Uncharacterized protein n=1 Tax=Clonostachys chloroleuca TaxID=1926264 RepID=A0AA35MJU8_9HYPO|nr:unnamed protein product [Clonostachys chloroleuca]